LLHRRLVISPAKLNLFLAITGRRPDGFHDLVSVVAPLGWGDDLSAQLTAGSATELECDDPAVPTGADNLIVQAAAAFAAARGAAAGIRFTLRKKVPMGAGLGGGSSNAATALRILNELASRDGRAPLGAGQLLDIAGRLGSDCPLFLSGGPVVMRGRGESLSSLPPGAVRRIAGRQVVVFKPGFAISTPWAYGRLASGAPRSYLPAAEAERRLALWLADESLPLECLLFNNMEVPAFAKFPALPALLRLIRDRHGLEARMSGSGSACFAVLPEGAGALGGEIAETVRGAWGESAFVQSTILDSGKIPV
jgi:4-diphosphocytidyl-2-C-methyl-D-erythritol kinase